MQITDQDGKLFQTIDGDGAFNGNKEPSFDIGEIDTCALSTSEMEKIVLKGHEKLPTRFPDDTCGHRFPTGVLSTTLQNGEKADRDWLVWSRTKKSLFCLPCRLFSKQDVSNRAALTSIQGYTCERNWRKLHDRVPEHENSNQHKACYVAWRQFEMRIKNQTSVDSLLMENIKTEAMRWRQILRRILNVVLFLGERGLAFRGNSSIIGDPGNGNFLGILELISNYDPILQEHLHKVKESQKKQTRLQVHYLSPEIQNEFIECCKNEVIKKIYQERETAKYYSIIVDATPDSAHIEQTVFILRYVLFNKDNHKFEIQERFLEFVDCNNKTGEAIAELIISTLKRHKIPLDDCRGQGYDNGSNMRGQYKGAQSRILKNHPLAAFAPCACHTLNLCGVQAAECCPEIITFFGIIQKLYNIFSSSPKRWEILQENIGCSLHSMSQTRWSARVDCVKPFATHISGIRNAIISIKNLNLTAETKYDLIGIESYIGSFQCVLLSSIWLKILTAINYRSTVLQARGATLDVEVQCIHALIKELEQFREQWPLILVKCKTEATSIGLSDTFEQRRHKIRKRHFDETVDETSNTDPENLFKQGIFYVIIDCLIGNMTSRFEAMSALQNKFHFLWNYCSLNEEDIAKQADSFCQFYQVDVSKALIEEMIHLKTIHNENIGPDSLPPIELLNKLHQLKMEIIFPNICIALRIFCTIPVSVAEGERSFSVLARIKNYLRSNMSQTRLTNLGTLALEPFLARTIDFNTIIDAFANQKARKVYFD